MVIDESVVKALVGISTAIVGVVLRGSHSFSFAVTDSDIFHPRSQILPPLNYKNFITAITKDAQEALHERDVPKSLFFMIMWLSLSLPLLLFFVFYETLVRPLFAERGEAYILLIVIVVLTLLPFIFMVISLASMFIAYILTYPLIYAKGLLKGDSERPRWAYFLVNFGFSTIYAAAAVVIAAFFYQVVHFWFTGSLDAATIKLTLYTLLIISASYFVLVLRLKRNDFGYYRGDIKLVVPIAVTYLRRKEAESAPTSQTTMTRVIGNLLPRLFSRR